ncbi:MAG: sigma-70 family RNA polymerase sigma factor [Gammaproteobacteria bacterium]|nr:sigma-70 family RNA polymerase sigma factor [Gammaproteobacteria bacterium]
MRRIARSYASDWRSPEMMSGNDITRQQLTHWFRTWLAPMRRHLSVRGRVPLADADDIAQEVFLRLLRFERTELVTHPQAYLFRIAANVLAERSVRASSRQPHAAEWLAQLTDDRNPEEECVRDEEQSGIRTAVAALPPRARTILRMHYEENLTHEAIAQRLNITRRMVKRDLIWAYADLRAAIRMEDR